eukprot:721576-Rhodomonas_salina.3
MFTRSFRVLALVAAATAGIEAFSTLPVFGASRSASLQLRGPRMATGQVGNVNDIPPGERLITKVGDQDVMVVNHKGDLYALSPKCPHLGLPMKTVSINFRQRSVDCRNE